jgi:predicted ester cyclase
MTAADNKQLFLRYQEALRHPEMLDEVLAPGFVAYDLPEGHRGVTDLKAFRERVKRNLPDQSFVLDYVVAEGDLVAAHMTTTQTLPTGERFTFCRLEIVGINADRIAWRRGYGDDRFNTLRQQARQQ